MVDLVEITLASDHFSDEAKIAFINADEVVSITPGSDGVSKIELTNGSNLTAQGTPADPAKLLG